MVFFVDGISNKHNTLKMNSLRYYGFKNICMPYYHKVIDNTVHTNCKRFYYRSLHYLLSTSCVRLRCHVRHYNHCSKRTVRQFECGVEYVLSREFSLSNLHRQIKPTEDSSVNIFDRQAKLFQRERAAGCPDVELYDYLKEEVGFRLADRVFDIKKKFKLAADLGCSRGYVSKHIMPESVEELILCDMSPTWLEQAVCPKDVNIQKKVVDEEKLPFEPNSLDLIISSLSLHWVNDLPGTFAQIMASLKNDGVFMAAVFGGDTLFELRSSLQLAELERHGGIAPHISPFTEIRDIGSLLTRAGFSMLTVDTDEIVVNYPSMFELMWDLKGMGENNASWNRKLHLRRDTALAAASIYEHLYGKNDEKGQKSVPATFKIIYMLGWKPDESQPKPLQRGSGEVSLKDLYKLDEIITETKKVKLEDEQRENK